MHQAVAPANNAPMRGQPIDDETVLAAALDATGAARAFISQEHEEARYAAGRGSPRALRGTQAAAGEDERVIAVEQPFSVRIEGDRVRGRYDAVRQTPRRRGHHRLQDR